METCKRNNEWIFWIIMSIPFIYLYSIWNTLPDTIPIHFNLRGEADKWGHKSNLIYITAIMVLPVYLIMLGIPYLDPKKKIEAMGQRYFALKFILVAFMAVLAIFIIYTSKVGSIQNPNLIYVMIGGIFVILGNYFPSIKPNYFMGIRTPWTLENEEVWKKTHRLGGKIWLIGGFLLMLFPFVIPQHLFLAFFFILLAVMVFIPVIYSYQEFQKIHHDETV